MITESEAKVAQSCLTLCNPTDYTVHGILQARILECVAFPSPGNLSNPGIEPRPLEKENHMSVNATVLLLADGQSPLRKLLSLGYSPYLSLGQHGLRKGNPWSTQ